MARRDNPTQSNAIAKRRLEAAIQNPSITDFRKEAEVFKFKPGEIEIEDTGTMCAAIWSDLADGRINPNEAMTFLNIVDRPLAVGDLSIRREELALKMEMRAKAAERQTERRQKRGR